MTVDNVNNVTKIYAQTVFQKLLLLQKDRTQWWPLKLCLISLLKKSFFDWYVLCNMLFKKLNAGQGTW